jgi:hypothetical protein
MKRLFSILVLTISFVAAFAQPEQAEMADVLRSNGKIYIVLGVVMIVLGGLFIYLFSIEKKVKKLEEKIENEK